MRRFKKLLLTVVTLLLGGCVTVIYDPTSSGYFTGQLFVMWIEEGGPSGDGIFLFVPNPRNRLTFHRNAPDGHGAIIQPGFMYTDGGSIPRIAQVFNGFSPWGYAPAYMIHDWLFTVRHCLVDGEINPKYDPVRDVSFEESARILGDGIRALVIERKVKRDDLAATTITAAVESFVARGMWDQNGECQKSKVSAKDIAAADEAIPGSAALLRAKRRAPLTGLELEVQSARAEVRGTPIKRAQLVTELSFDRK
jgi:hypothetical protein